MDPLTEVAPGVLGLTWTLSTFPGDFSVDPEPSTLFSSDRLGGRCRCVPAAAPESVLSWHTSFPLACWPAERLSRRWQHDWCFALEHQPELSLQVTVQAAVPDVELPGRTLALGAVGTCLKSLSKCRCLGPTLEGLRNAGVEGLHLT